MRDTPLMGYVPSLHFQHYWEKKEKFFEYESVHKDWIVFGVEDGSFYFEIENNQGTASFGDLVLCPPGSTFRRVVISPISLFVFHMNWKDHEGKEQPLENLGNIPVGKIMVANTERLLSNYAAMKQNRFFLEHWNMMRHNHYLHNIWLLFCEESEGVTNEVDYKLFSDPFIQQATLLIKKHAFDQQMNIGFIASTLGISRVSLSKKFRTGLGTTPIKYLTDIRLKKAKSLLMNTNLTLDEISECCGYQNGFYLNRVFTKNCNITPMQFRKEHRL